MNLVNISLLTELRFIVETELRFIVERGSINISLLAERREAEPFRTSAAEPPL